jgi:hypothetical protein
VASFVTIEEDAKQIANQKKTEKEKAKRAAKKAAAAAESGQEQGGKQKQLKDLSHIQRFKCKEFRHFSTSPDCPKNQEKATVNLTKEDTYCYLTSEDYEASIFTTREKYVEIEEHTVEKAVYVTRELKSTDVLLDYQADISIMHPCLLTNVKQAKKNITVSGVGGVQLIVDKVGFLDGFFEVYSSTETKANVLSMATVEEVYPIMYKQQESFTMHMEDRYIEFKQRGRLYVAVRPIVGAAIATIQENEQLYTKEEVRRAKLAYEFIRSSGYLSPEEVVHLLIDGNVPRDTKTNGSRCEARI